MRAHSLTLSKMTPTALLHNAPPLYHFVSLLLARLLPLLQSLQHSRGTDVSQSARMAELPQFLLQTFERVARNAPNG
jgi:hypothetical protein